MTDADASIGRALREFAASVTAKGAGLSTGAPEDRLRAPFENLMSDAAALFASNIVCAGETPLPDRLGRPDYAVLRDGALAGYVELKAPGVGADARRLRGRDREQFRRFSSVPNILYGDGNEWALYRGGERAGLVRFSGDVAADGAKAVSAEDARAFMELLRDFLLWEPIPPLDRNGKIDLKGFAAMLAPLCRMLRDDVTDALRGGSSPLAILARDWRQLPFPNATDSQFADSYAQTVAFALLLGRSEGADPLTLESAQGALAAQHSLLSAPCKFLPTRARGRTSRRRSTCCCAWFPLSRRSPSPALPTPGFISMRTFWRITTPGCARTPASTTPRSRWSTPSSA